MEANIEQGERPRSAPPNNTAPLNDGWPPSEISEVGDRKTRIAWTTLQKVAAQALQAPEADIGIDRVVDHGAPPRDLEKDYLNPRDVTVVWRNRQAGIVVDLVRVDLYEPKNGANRDELVPIVHAIPSPGGFGAMVKKAIDADTKARFGMEAGEAISGWAGYLKHELHEHNGALRNIAYTLVGISMVTGVGFGGVRGCQAYNRHSDEAAKVWVDQRPQRIDSLKRQIQITLENRGDKAVVNHFMSEFGDKQLDDIKNLLQSGTHEQRLEAMQMLRDCRSIKQAWDSLKGWGEADYGTLNDDVIRKILLDAAKDGANGPIITELSKAVKELQPPAK